MENRHALVVSAKNGSIMKSMAKSTSSLKIKDSFGQVSKMDSIMKSMAMVDFFIENKGTFFPYHYITYGNKHVFGPLSAKMDSIMKSMAMVDFFVKISKRALVKGICENGRLDNEIHGYNATSSLKIKELSSHIITLPMETDALWNFLPISLHYLWKQTTALVRICENGSIMKSMAMVDFFIENKGKLQLKQQDIINHTKVGKGVNFLCKWNFSSHIITLPMETETGLLVNYLRKWIMKSMAMVDFFIENKRNFLPISLHYLWKQTRFGPLGLRKWVDNEIHGYGGTSSLKIKGTFFPYHYITYEANKLWNFLPISLHYLWKQNNALVVSAKNGLIMKSMAMNWTSSLKIKGTFFPYHYITYGNKPRFWSLSAKMDSIMKSMAMVDFFIENKGTFFPYHYITYGSGAGLWWTALVVLRKWVDNEIHGYGGASSLKIKGTFFPYHYITYGSNDALVIICENGSIMKSMAMVDFFIENKRYLPKKWVDNERIHGYEYDFFIENKRNFLPISLHYLWKRNSFGQVSAENGSIMKSMAIVDFFIENKGTFFPYHYITYGSRTLAFGTFFPYHYITYGNKHRFGQYICENGFDNEIHGYGGLLH
ncbi:hypothetical protein H6P81_021643 [Aristolochia fimbriata]|uniref:Uncharacterized protein n=1 Tax=Aristolochia fimbriata TaxID=158543 RepID=A0AAV7DS01_ARIFI|nr:hypothetical protein H6P81_021643 [Aristolochia fimbriata]